MPYTEITEQMVDGKRKWCFRNKETGQRICADTREKAVAAMRAKYAHHTEEMKYLDPKQNRMIRIKED
ncbi:MAG: hypothetical protein WAV28_15790 [Sedimentisphaerales bacterium]